MSLVIVAVDPGPTTGLCVLNYRSPEVVPDVSLMQIEGSSVVTTLEWLLEGLDRIEMYDVDTRLAVIESFVPSRGGASSTKDAEVTRELIPRIEPVLMSYHFKIHRQKAADVKPWATDKRLQKVMPNVKAKIHGKSRDAFDAGRHAIYCATKHGGVADPLR